MTTKEKKRQKVIKNYDITEKDFEKYNIGSFIVDRKYKGDKAEILFYHNGKLVGIKIKKVN